MIVKEFLKSLNIDDLVNAYCLYENDICNNHGTGNRTFHKNKTKVKKVFEKILSLDPIINNDCIVFSTPELGTQCLDSFLIQKEELFDPSIDRIEHYGYELCSMREILGYQISNACRFQLDDDLQYACSIIFEMTFFGYDPDIQEKETIKESDLLNDQIEKIESGNVEAVPMLETLISKYNINLNNKKSQKEIQFEEQFNVVIKNYYKDMMDALYDLEKYYQKS